MGLFELLQKIVVVFEGIQIPYLITGAVAAMAYGEPRLTGVTHASVPAFSCSIFSWSHMDISWVTGRLWNFKIMKINGNQDNRVF